MLCLHADFSVPRAESETVGAALAVTVLSRWAVSVADESVGVDPFVTLKNNLCGKKNVFNNVFKVFKCVKIFEWFACMTFLYLVLESWVLESWVLGLPFLL